jgi:hypothetical protein
VLAFALAVRAELYRGEAVRPAVGGQGAALGARAGRPRARRRVRDAQGLLGATLFFLLANLATDMVYGPQADRPEWMTKSRTYPLLNASGRAIVDWVEARRQHAGGRA